MPSRPAAAVFALVAALGGVPAAHANDRPFQIARTAVLGDDDEDQTWSLETWVQRLGSIRGLSVEPEYTFGDGNSVQMELSRYVDRHDRETGHEAEVEFKHVFNDIAKDGWGWAVSAAVSARRNRETDGTVPAIGFKLPVSVQIAGGLLHLDVGIGKASDARRTVVGAVGAEREIAKGTHLFGEAARDGDTTSLQIGVRHWVKREVLAIDVSLQRQHDDVGRGAGFILGLGWYGF